MAELDARRLEVLSNAARIIQWRIRTHIAHRQFVELRKLAIYLQSLCKSTLFVMIDNHANVTMLGEKTACL